MDIFAHALWVGAGATYLEQRNRISRRTLWWTIAFTVAPDIPLFLPLLLWAVLPSGSLNMFVDYIFATPGREPAIPSSVLSISNHLHCTMHSVVILAILTLVTLFIRKKFLFPLAGWWIHIVIDIFTHSKDYYAVPIFYPFSEQGFDGLAWNSPQFLIINYLLIVFSYLYLFFFRKHPR